MITVPAKTIVTKTKSDMWFGSDYNMNIYRGCSHGCIYCDSRSECYRDDSFELVKVKEDALRIIRDDLRRKVRRGVVATGAMSDPYNPLEESLELTRHALELLGAYGFGAAIATKSPLVARDIDILREIKEHSPVIVKVTVTEADESASKIIEPYAPSVGERFGAISKLSEAGIFCGILLMPVLPFITDGEENIKKILKLSAASGAKFVYPAFGVTLRDRQREYFYSRLDEKFPGLREEYVKRYGTRYSCGSPRAKKLKELFAKDCAQLSMLCEMRDIISAYKQRYQYKQHSLFEMDF